MGKGPGANDDSNDGFFSHNNSPICDHHVDLRNLFHKPKLNFPRYDEESDPLPWLNHCEFFRGT
jgi:hypothetical protein